MKLRDELQRKPERISILIDKFMGKDPFLLVPPGSTEGRPWVKELEEFGYTSSDWPKKSITVVIPTKPGGSADQTLQPLKVLMEKELGVKLLYSYKPGAGGELGWSILYQKCADGYTIGGFWTPHMQNTTIFRNNKIIYNTIEDIIL